MKVLIGCEFSGVVRSAFLEKGHDAWSCDLLPSEIEGPHLQEDVLGVLDRGWDLAIFHPPCTYLCSSGLHWNKRIEGRERLTTEAVEFVRTLLDAPIPRIALENPVGRIGTAIRPADQIIQPWMFGEDASKGTCLWLKGLPLLQPTLSMQRPVWIPCPESCGDWWCQRHRAHTADCECPELEKWIEKGDDPYYRYYGNQTPSGQNKLGPSPTRAADRARTYRGIAEAFASQWS